MNGDVVFVVEVDCPTGCSFKIRLKVGVVKFHYAPKTIDGSPLSQEVLGIEELSEECSIESIVEVNSEVAIVEIADREVYDTIVVPMTGRGVASIMSRRVIILVGRHDLDPNRVVAWKAVKVVR